MLTLLDKVKKYKEVDFRFHTPSHCFGITEELYSNAKFDITELSFSDNLLSPTGVIKELETELSRVYNTFRTLVITTGATCGNFIGLNLLKDLGKVLVTPNAHKSIYSAIRLFNVDAKFMEDRYYPNGLPMPVTMEDIKSYLTPDIKGVVITSPTYFGDVVKTELIKDLQNRGIVVMVDEAHGGHFNFSSLLPESLSSIADIVIDSVHKTLPVYTGGALIHINNASLITKAELYHSLLHSSSPNYVTMCSIDYSQDLFNREGERLYRELFRVVKNINLEKFKIIKNADFSRLVIDTLPYDAGYVAEELEKNKVFIEMSYKHYLVLILSPLNIENFVKAVDIINNVSNKLCGHLYVEQSVKKSVSQVKTNKEIELINLQNAINRVSASEVGIYPPGVPLIKNGDIITREQVEFLLENKGKLFGLIDHKIYVEK